MLQLPTFFNPATRLITFVVALQFSQIEDLY